MNEEIKKLMAVDSKAWVIWASCIEKPMTLQNIMKEWSYQEKAGALYRRNILNGMFRNKIISVAEVGGGNLYKAEFGWIDKAFLQFLIPKEETENEFALVGYPSIIENAEDLIRWWSDEKYHPILFNLNSLKVLYRHDYNNLKRNPAALFVYPLTAVYILKLPKKKRKTFELLFKGWNSLALALFSFDLVGYINSIDDKEIKKMEIPQVYYKIIGKWEKHGKNII